MKYLFTVTFLLLIVFCSYSQEAAQTNLNTRHFKLIPGSNTSALYRVEIFSDIDPSWNKWTQRGYNFGFDPSLTPMYTQVNGILSTPYMIQVRGNENEKYMKRWGYHVFEGYASDDKSRITMLVNKHEEEGKPVAELYYYGTVYNHSDQAYNWFRVGSDVRQHSFMFSRDKALFYGSLKLTNAFTLGSLGKSDIRDNKPEGNDEIVYAEDAKFVNYTALKDSDNGTMFYDKDNDIVVIKINGQWMKMAVEPLPEDIKYDF